MQGYLKLKEKDEELYEIELSDLPSHKIVNTLIYLYLQFIVKIKKWLHIIAVKEIYFANFSLGKKSNKTVKEMYSKNKKIDEKVSNIANSNSRRIKTK